MKNLKDDIRDGLSGLGDAVRRLRGVSEDPLTAALAALKTSVEGKTACSAGVTVFTAK
jgi:hypothetical protein